MTELTETGSEKSQVSRSRVVFYCPVISVFATVSGMKAVNTVADNRQTGIGEQIDLQVR